MPETAYKNYLKFKLRGINKINLIQLVPVDLMLGRGEGGGGGNPAMDKNHIHAAVETLLHVVTNATETGWN